MFYNAKVGLPNLTRIQGRASVQCESVDTAYEVAVLSMLKRDRECISHLLNRLCGITQGKRKSTRQFKKKDTQIQNKAPLTDPCD